MFYAPQWACSVERKEVNNKNVIVESVFCHEARPENACIVFFLVRDGGHGGWHHPYQSSQIKVPRARIILYVRYGLVATKIVAAPLASLPCRHVARRAFTDQAGMLASNANGWGGLLGIIYELILYVGKKLLRWLPE